MTHERQVPIAQGRWPSADEHWEWWVSRSESYPLPIGERPPSLPFEELDEARRREAEEAEALAQIGGHDATDA